MGGWRIRDYPTFRRRRKDMDGPARWQTGELPPTGVFHGSFSRQYAWLANRSGSDDPSDLGRWKNLAADRFSNAIFDVRDVLYQRALLDGGGRRRVAEC